MEDVEGGYDFAAPADISESDEAGEDVPSY